MAAGVCAKFHDDVRCSQDAGGRGGCGYVPPSAFHPDRKATTCDSPPQCARGFTWSGTTTTTLPTSCTWADGW